MYTEPNRDLLSFYSGDGPTGQPLVLSGAMTRVGIISYQSSSEYLYATFTSDNAVSVRGFYAGVTQESANGKSKNRRWESFRRFRIDDAVSVAIATTTWLWVIVVWCYVFQFAKFRLIANFIWLLIQTNGLCGNIDKTKKYIVIKKQ